MGYILASGYLKLSLSLVNTHEDFLLWLFFTIVLAVLPIGFSFLVLMFFATWKVSFRNYLDLLADGELFFFSTTLSAASLNKLAALQNLPAVATNTTAPSSDPPSFIQVALYMILLLSTFIFALCTYFKLNKEAQLQGAAGGTQPQGAAGGTGISIPNRWGIALGSVFCAIAAGFLSYLVYTYGGT